MHRWVVTIVRECCEDCLDKEYEILFKYEWQAKEFVEKQLSYWDCLVTQNNVPKRTFIIREYKYDECNLSNKQDGLVASERG